LVLARGHRVEKIAEIPLVVADKEIEGVSKTKAAIKLLQSLNAYDDVEKVKASHHIRSGKGKARNRRYVQRKGPLIVHDKHTQESALWTSFRNIPGVELIHVSRLNLLQLAPGGHLGRFVIWTQSAFKQLDAIFGSLKSDSKQKLNYRPPRAILSQPDIGRIINSTEVQSVLRRKIVTHKYRPLKKNPLTNLGALVKLNPYALTQRRRAILASQKASAARKSAVKAKRSTGASFLAVLRTPSVAPPRGEDEVPIQY
jgi:large subunit ribosomal protein L4e